jgi:hypothetical protein
VREFESGRSQYLVVFVLSFPSLFPVDTVLQALLAYDVPVVLWTGGEALEVVSTAAARAAEEAQTGAWLRELESGGPLTAVAPGLPYGLFTEGSQGPPRVLDLQLLAQCRLHASF